jgi:hypothetical protein
VVKTAFTELSSDRINKKAETRGIVMATVDETTEEPYIARAITGKVSLSISMLQRSSNHGAPGTRRNVSMISFP